MSSYSSTAESGSNVLTGAVIAASALLLYAAFALPAVTQPAQTAAAAPVVEQVVVTAPRHVS